MQSFSTIFTKGNNSKTSYLFPFVTTVLLSKYYDFYTANNVHFSKLRHAAS